MSRVKKVLIGFAVVATVAVTASYAYLIFSDLSPSPRERADGACRAAVTTLLPEGWTGEQWWSSVPVVTGEGSNLSLAGWRFNGRVRSLNDDVSFECVTDDLGVVESFGLK